MIGWREEPWRTVVGQAVSILVGPDLFFSLGTVWGPLANETRSLKPKAGSASRLGPTRPMTPATAKPVRQRRGELGLQRLIVLFSFWIKKFGDIVGGDYLFLVLFFR